MEGTSDDLGRPTPYCTDTFSGLRSEVSTQRLEQIARLRARGIGEHIDPPQLFVCGDQSVGKSSVLEGLTGLPFLRQDGLCTRFATEIVLKHAEEPMKIQAEIIPHHSRSEASVLALKTFVRTLENIEELTGVITEAATLMGIRHTASMVEGPAFASDILRISVFEKTGLHLSVVDLPGLISVLSEEQIEDDLETVHALVDKYISKDVPSSSLSCRPTTILRIKASSTSLGNTIL